MKSLQNTISESLLTIGLPRNEVDFNKEKEILQANIKDAKMDLKTYNMLANSNKYKENIRAQYRYKYGIKRAELEIEMCRELLKYIELNK